MDLTGVAFLSVDLLWTHGCWDNDDDDDDDEREREKEGQRGSFGGKEEIITQTKKVKGRG